MKISSILTIAILSTGCAATQPAPFIYDFDEDSVKVAVGYDILGPSLNDAYNASLPLAQQQCLSFQKDVVPVSQLREPFDTYKGRYLFLYQCQGADIVKIEDLN